MLGEIIADLSNWMYTYLLVILLVAAGLFFTIRNRFPQLRLLREAIRVVVERPEKEGSVSSFQALMVSTASRVGTGNIIGVSVAICMGGYGAVFWMWLIALLGGATAFTESTLAQIYKRRNPETGESYGGPAYYIEAALHSRPLAVLFALSLIATYAGGFNMLCSYNLQSTFSGYSFYSPEWTPWIIGGIVALLTGYCVMGGGKRIVKVTSTLVPFMGGLYVLVSLIVIVMNFGLLPQVLGRIFSEAFDFQAIFGGLAGSCLMYGIKRGLYSNEAGVGSAPNAAASANVSHPVKQGLVQMLSVFIDTLLICTATAFMLLCSGVEPDAALEGAPYVQAALSVRSHRPHVHYGGDGALRLHHPHRQPLLCGQLPELHRQEGPRQGVHGPLPHRCHAPDLHRRRDADRHRVEPGRCAHGRDGPDQPAGHHPPQPPRPAGSEGLHCAEEHRPQPGVQGRDCGPQGQDRILELIPSASQTGWPQPGPACFLRCTSARSPLTRVRQVRRRLPEPGGGRPVRSPESTPHTPPAELRR